MFRQWLNYIQLPCYSPDDILGTGGTRDLSASDILAELNADDDETDDKIDLEDKEDDDAKGRKGKKASADKDEDSTDDEDEVDDDKDDKEDSDDEDSDDDSLEDDLEKDLEDEDVDEEKLKLVTPVRRKEILKKYPKLFKEFPYLETAYYREQAFTAIFPNPAEAKEAREASETLENFEKELFDGKTENILKAVKSETPKAFAKLVDDYLPTLARIDEKAYHHVLGNTIKETIITMVDEAKRSGNDGLRAAALLLNQFVFGTSDFVAPKKLAPATTTEVDPERAELDRQKLEFDQTRFNTANDDLNRRVNNSIKATIEENIDKKDDMSSFIKKHAVKQALEEVEGLIEKDARFKTIIYKLWEKAAKSNYSSDSMNDIRSAFLSKARTLLPTVIKKARTEGLKGMGKRPREDKDDEVITRKSKDRQLDEPLSQKKNSSGNKPSNSKDKIPAGMSSLEYLMKD